MTEKENKWFQSHFPYAIITSEGRTPVSVAFGNAGTCKDGLTCS